MVVALIALFLAMGGTAYAAARIDGKLIKKNSEPGNRINKNTYVAKARLALNAGHATSADNASHASAADNASHASSADTATNAGHATNADSANPVAFAHISAAGVIDQARSKGMASATVTNPQAGVYCLRGLGFAFKGAQVTTDFDDSTGEIAAQFGSTAPSTCNPQADAYVATVGSDDLGHNAGFYIVFYN